MVFKQNQRVRNPVGQQVRNHCKSPTTYLKINHSSRQIFGCQDWRVYSCIPPSVLIHSPVFPLTDWQLWTAATLTDEALRTTMITLVKKYASSRLNSDPFPDRYSSETGKMIMFQNRAVVGGHFALVRRWLPLEVLGD